MSFAYRILRAREAYENFEEEKDSFYAILKIKIVSAVIRTPIHGLWSELSTTELFDLLMTGHNYKQISSTNIFVYISILCTHIVNIATKMMCKNSSRIDMKM